MYNLTKYKLTENQYDSAKKAASSIRALLKPSMKGRYKRVYTEPRVKGLVTKYWDLTRFVHPDFFEDAIRAFNYVHPEFKATYWMDNNTIFIRLTLR